MDGEEAIIEDDDRHTILEMHLDINMPEEFDDPDGIARPYVITIDKSSQEILSIRKNWYEDDEKKKKRMHFIHYKYLPGLGFYGTGLIHLIGGLAKSATSILRQLIDAGTLSNLPAGLKARGMRIKGDDTPLMPGEFRDVDVPGGAIRDSITFIPYKEPSGVLYSLLGNIVEEGRRIGSVADIQVGDMNAQAPVGTTLALLERSMKVMSGVQARLHAAMKKELRLLAKIVHDYMPAEYAYEMEGDFSRTEDFDKRIDVIPVSDPNAATMSQRIMQYQAALQLSQQAPQLYDMGKLHRQMLEVLGIQDAGDIIKLPDDIKPADPCDRKHDDPKTRACEGFQVSGPRSTHRCSHGGGTRPKDYADGGAVSVRAADTASNGCTYNRACCVPVSPRDREAAWRRNAKRRATTTRKYRGRYFSLGERRSRKAVEERSDRSTTTASCQTAARSRCADAATRVTAQSTGAAA